MKLLASILILIGFCLFSFIYYREPSIPSDSFHLTVQRVFTSDDIVVSVLKVKTTQNTTLHVDSPIYKEYITLRDFPASAVREGQVTLSASRISPSLDAAYIQTLSRLEYSNNVSAESGGGPYAWPVPTATKLANFYSISAVNGDYKLDKPIKIGQENGKPIFLTVARLKEEHAQNN